MYATARSKTARYHQFTRPADLKRSRPGII
jgi:hypothetical protein